MSSNIANHIIDGKKFAEKINSESKNLIVNYTSKFKRKPSFHIILIGENKDSIKYINKKISLSESLGIEVKLTKLKEDISQEKVEELISDLALNNDIDALLLQLPLPSHLDTQKLLELIPIEKDIDVISTTSFNELKNLNFNIIPKFNDDLFNVLLPCTPAGVVYLIRDTLLSLKGSSKIIGLNALVIGRSNLVGKPSALLLELLGANVSVAHSGTSREELKELSIKSDIIVSACGVPGIIDASFIKNGSLLVDVGLTWVQDKGLLGDIDFESCANKASAITPVPGGVGPVTLAMLMRNILISANMNTNNK